MDRWMDMDIDIDRDRDIDMHTYVHVCVYTYIYIYIHIYIYVYVYGYTLSILMWIFDGIKYLIRYLGSLGRPPGPLQFNGCLPDPVLPMLTRFLFPEWKPKMSKR